VEVQKNATDPNRIGGTLAGAAIGGLLGNQVGGGNGKKLATVAGAVAGAAAGRTIQGNRQQANGNRRVERVCERR
ncbi:glycine zipper 2TM domain-containing protein, partial [Xanthomonas oryzae pv. oryzicola]